MTLEAETTVETTPVESTPAPSPVVSRPSLESRQSSAFDDIVAETLAELEETDETTEVPTAEEDEDTSSDDTEEEDEDTEVVEESDTTDEPDDDTEVEEEETAEEEPKTDSKFDEFLALLKDKDKLDAALRLSNVEDIEQLPIVKDLLGRERQSTTDKVRNELAREKLQDQAITQVLKKGTEAQDKLVSVMDKLATDLQRGMDEGFDDVDLQIPDGNFIKERLNEFADASVHAYHNANFLPLSEVIYTLPELQALSQEQQTQLAEAAGKEPSVWLQEHLQVARVNLWNMAQQALAEVKDQELKDRTLLLEEAHKKEVETLTTKHEKNLEKAVAKAKTATRNEVLAELATNGLPPRSVPKEEAVTQHAEVDDDGSIDSFFAQAKRELAAKQASGASSV